MADSKSKSWFNLGAVALAVIIVVAVIWLKAPEDETPVVEDVAALPEIPGEAGEDIIPESTSTQGNQVMQEYKESVQRDEKQISLQQFKETRKEYHQLLMKQRQQLESEYLNVAQKLFEKDPTYTASLDRKDDWPFEQFGTDFQSFKTSREKYLEILSGQAKSISDLLDDIETAISNLLPLAIEASPEYLEKEDEVMEKLAQLDKALAEFNLEG